MEEKRVEKPSENFTSIYSNFVSMRSGLYDFVFMFGRISPIATPVASKMDQQQSEEVIAPIFEAEVYMSPQHAKVFYLLLKEHIEKFEQRFGEIKLPPDVLQEKETKEEQ